MINFELEFILLKLWIDPARSKWQVAMDLNEPINQPTESNEIPEGYPSSKTRFVSDVCCFCLKRHGTLMIGMSDYYWCCIHRRLTPLALSSAARPSSR
jgi:hypothetical protein